MNNNIEELSWSYDIDSFDDFKYNIILKSESSKYLYFSGHSENSLFFKQKKNKTDSLDCTFNPFQGKLVCSNLSDHEITPDDIVNMSLEGANVVINTCYGTKNNYYSLLEGETLANSFILAGAKYVITATREVNDYDAFRFFCRFNELLFMENLSFKKAYRNTCLESTENTLPTYLTFIKENSTKDIFVGALHRSKNGENSAEAYTLWESN